MRRAAIVAGAVVMLAGCSDGGGPVGGELEVRLSGQEQARAVTFALVGPGTAVTAPAGSGNRVFVAGLGADTSQVIVVGPSSGALQAGPIARIAVPDVGRAGDYRAIVREVAGPSYVVLDPRSFTLTVARP